MWLCNLCFKSCTHCNHLGHVALRAGVLSRILHPHQNQEVEVVPHIVLRFYVLLKGHRLVVKFVPFQTWKTAAFINECPSNHVFFPPPPPNLQMSFHAALRTTDETGGFKDLLFSLLLASQVCKRVDDHAEDQIENDDDDDEEEEKVVNHSSRKQRLLKGSDIYKYIYLK